MASMLHRVPTVGEARHPQCAGRQARQEEIDMAGPGPLRDISPNEQQLVERAIGSAVLGKLRGSPSSLIGAYQALGGGDQTTISALGAVDRGFESWDLSEAGRVAAAAAPAASFAEA